MSILVYFFFGAKLWFGLTVIYSSQNLRMKHFGNIDWIKSYTVSFSINKYITSKMFYMFILGYCTFGAKLGFGLTVIYFSTKSKNDHYRNID